MGLTGIMNTGITGLTINADAMSVIGNNIANVNTTGFKEGRTLFSDVLSQNIAKGQIGRGGQIQAVQNNFTQGGIENTAKNNDLAIQGESFFIVKDAATGANFYTRAGAFDYNLNNVLVNPDGLEVQGYGILQTTGLQNGTLGKIDKTAFATLSPVATSSASLIMNLDSTAQTPGSEVTSQVTVKGDFGAAAFPAPATVNVYDEFGNAHLATITWGGATPNYTYSIAIAGAAPGTAGSAGSPIFGNLNFPLTTSASVTNKITLANNARSMDLKFDFAQMANGAAAVLPTATADGSAIKTGTVVLSGQTAGGAVGSFIDKTGAAHAMTITFGAGTWTADIVGAANTYPPAGPFTNTIGGTFTSGAGGTSTWDQNSATVSIGGVAQPVLFDLRNVTAGAAATTASITGFDKTDAAITSNFSTAFQVFDDQGNSHTATVYYDKVGANTWNYHLSVLDALSVNGMAGNTVMNGVLAFNSNGSMQTQTPTSSTTITMQFPGAVSANTLTLDLNQAVTTQLASASKASSITQNGYGAGTLIATKIDGEGYVNATYSNNQTQRIAQLALTNFASTDGLEKSGNSLYNYTTKSGQPNPNTAVALGSKIFTNSLEQSNVDMATQLVTMIKLQRAYSGNSKTITTSDEMLQETLQLKR